MYYDLIVFVKSICEINKEDRLLTAVSHEITFKGRNKRVNSFQTEFLKPFENTLINNINTYRIKEYILTSINSLVTLVLTEARGVPIVEKKYRIGYADIKINADI